jgi:hypothetical protein
MVRCILISVLVLAGCNTPTQHFRGIPPTRVSVDGSVFDVRVRGDLAEAIRVNPQYAPRFGPIRERAAFAMSQVSGCRVTEVRGDQALATGLLSCGKRPRTWAAPAAGVSYSCLDVAQWLNDASGVSYAEFDCDPY